MQTPYEIVVFDLWETLITRPFRENLYQRIAKAIGCELDQVIEIVRLTWFRDDRKDRAAFARHLANFLDEDNGEQERSMALEDKVEQAIVEHEENERHPNWIDGAFETLGALKAAGVHLVLASNATVNTRRLLESSWMRDQLAPQFDEILLSCEVGFTKPDPRLLLKSERVRDASTTGQVCVVGDQFDTDILTAQILGFDAILLRKKDQESTTGDPAPRAEWQQCRPRIARSESFIDVARLLGMKND